MNSDTTTHAADQPSAAPASAPVPLGPFGKAGKWCVVVIVVFYRAALRPFMGGACRYQPTCSQYMLEAVDKHGPAKGGWMGVKRICRCHPWGGFGYDPP